MSDPVQLAPTLAIFEDDGDFTVRVNESPLAKSLTPALLKAIGELTKAKKLTLLTPTDTKIFKLNGNVQSTAAQPSPSEDVPPQTPPSRVRRISQDQSAPPAPEVAEEAIDEYDQALAEAKKAEQEIAHMERSNRQQVDFPEPEPEPEQTKVRKRDRARPEPVANSACGRCGGTGDIGGGACPVCRGRGQIAKWGTGRR